MKINNYKPILQNDIYPKLSSMVDAAFPEFEFKEKGKQWISTNTLHLSGIEGVHGKGKVTVLKSKPYAIGDFREGTKEVINYLVGSAFHPQVTDFKNAVEYLASITNVELNNTSIITDWKRKKFVPKPIQQTKPIYIPTDLFKASLSDYDNNDFAQYLNRLLGTEKAKELIERFYIGTSKYWNGPTTVFWLIDIKKQIAGGQIVLFDKNGNTYKETKKNGTKKRFNSWVHSAIKNTYKKDNKPLPEWLKNYIANSPKFPCLFGLPQLDKEPLTKPVAIVEAAKTAIIATAYLPQYIWLAVGSLSYLNKNRLKDLKGRNITLFPDKGGFERWNNKAKELSDLANFTVSDLLERKEAEQGSDLADYLIKYDWRIFQPEESKEPIKEPILEPEPTRAEPLQNDWEIVDCQKWQQEDSQPSEPKPNQWQERVNRLSQFFEAANLPTILELSACARITNVQKFVQSHLSIIQNNQNKAVYLPYLERLEQIEQLIKEVERSEPLNIAA